MPEREIIVRADKLPFSKVIAYGDFVFVSGIVGRDPETGKIASGDVAEQTRQVMKNIQQLLAAAETSLDRALKVTIFITDMSLFGAMNEAYRSFFTADLPARSCVQVVSVPDKEALVEIELIAGRA